MNAGKLEVFWKGELVGFIEDAQVDMFHLYGKWIQGNGPVAAEFMAELRSALDRWDENMAGVEVTVGKEAPMVGEFTDLTDGTADILLRPH